MTDACNAGRVHHVHPLIIEVDTIQMQADGNTIFRAGTTVYLTEETPPECCQLLPADNREYELLVDSWGDDEPRSEVVTSSEEE